MTGEDKSKTHIRNDLNIIIKEVLSDDDYVYLKGLSEVDREKNKWEIASFYTAVFSACSELGTERARDIFASEKLTDLTDKFWFTNFLVKNDTKLMSRKELERDTELLLNELFQNRDDIIRTGLPKTHGPYGYSFLRYELSSLYCLGRRWGRDDDVPYGQDFHGFFDLDISSTNKRANKIRGLSDEDIKKIETDRPMLLDLKIMIIRELLSSLKNHGEEAAWVKCLKLMTEKLDKHDLDFYARVDTLYEHDGGITPLFNVIEYYEIESQLSFFSKMHDALGNLIRVNKEGYRGFSFKCYFGAVKYSKQKPINRAYEIYLSCKSEMVEFLKEYHRDVIKFINEGFKERVVSAVTVDPELAEGIKKQGDVFLEYMKTQSERIGYVPVYDVTIRDPEYTPRVLFDTKGKHLKEAVPEVCFYKAGRRWFIGELGKAMSLEEMDGMIYIHSLLGCPGIDIEADTLYDKGETFLVSDVGKAYSGLSSKALDRKERGLRIGRPSKTKAGTKKFKSLTKEERRERKEALQNEKEDLSGTDKRLDDAYEEKQTRIEEINNELAILDINEEHDLTPSEDSARTKVQKAIKRAMKTILNEIPSMGNYLTKKAIRTGETCSYISYESRIPCKWLLFPEDLNKRN